MKYDSILITGGAGFLGSNLAIYFKKKYSNIKIIALDNLKRRGSELNIARFKTAGVKFVHGDVRNSEDLASLKPNLIIECSAEPSVMAGVNGSPEYLLNTNLGGAVNCLELARKVKADFYFVSTSRVYPYHLINSAKFNQSKQRFNFAPKQNIVGLSEKGISEELSLDGARSLYGTTKLSAELFVAEYAESFGIKTVINRFGCIAGPWQMGKVDQGVMALWVYKHFFKQSLNYIGFGGQGKQVRDFIHIDDAVEVIDLQLNNLDKVKGKTLNVGGGFDNSISLQQLTALCQKVTGNQIKIGSEAKTRPVDLKSYITDNSQIEKLLDWRPKKSIEDIVADTYDWVAKHQQDLKNIWL